MHHRYTPGEIERDGWRLGEHMIVSVVLSVVFLFLYRDGYFRKLRSVYCMLSMSLTSNQNVVKCTAVKSELRAL